MYVNIVIGGSAVADRLDYFPKMPDNPFAGPGASDKPDRSNDQADVARRILELSETISQAIDYMLDRFGYAREAAREAVWEVAPDTQDAQDAPGTMHAPYAPDTQTAFAVTVVPDAPYTPSTPAAPAAVHTGMLKDVCEGLMSLDKAVSAVSEPLGADPENIMRIAAGYDELTERLDAMADACLDGRDADLPALGARLRDSFGAYAEILAICFRRTAIM
jgi:hypothetical protein